MEIKNFGSNEFADYKREIDRGGKFVMFQYSVSIIFYSYRINTPIYLIKGGESGVSHFAKYSLVSLVAGWWGIPWGHVYTVQSIYNNFKGGIDVTSDVLEYKNKQLNPRSQYF